MSITDTRPGVACRSALDYLIIQTYLNVHYKSISEARVSQGDQDLRERHFVEEVGLLLEQWGMARMAGRVLGRLLICQPTHQSSAELAEYLGASRASISTSTRVLMRAGLAQRVAIQGTRASYFAVQPSSFDMLFQAELMQSRLAREVLDRGLDVMAGSPSSATERLREMRDLFAFVEHEMPALLQRWRTQRENR
jgi:Predicted transcriptional regulators